jgi:hypothetical protein
MKLRFNLLIAIIFSCIAFSNAYALESKKLDMFDKNLGRNVPVVIYQGVTINKPVVIISLKTLYDHLSDEGVLLFEGETLKAVPPLDVWCRSVWHKPNGQMIMLSSLATMKDNVCNSIGKYELAHNNSTR